MSSTVYQISVSQGGVPKLPIPEAQINADGVTGDKQGNRKVHGGPNRAVCLYSLELIEALQDEGHPIQAGTTGENLTVAGFNLEAWAGFKKGTRFAIGQSLVLEVTGFAAPCQNIAFNFVDQNFSRISQKLHPGWGRLYTKVLTPGQVTTGDPVQVLATPEG